MNATADNTVERLARWPALRGPALVALGAVAATALVHFRDPHVDGSYGFCPFNALTGLYCPGCGATRAANDLTNLDVGAAISSNALAVGLAVTLVVAFVRWLPRRWNGGGARMIVLSNPVGVIVVALMIVFAIVRNTPWGAWLAP